MKKLAEEDLDYCMGEILYLDEVRFGLDKELGKLWRRIEGSRFFETFLGEYVRSKSLA